MPTAPLPVRSQGVYYCDTCPHSYQSEGGDFCTSCEGATCLDDVVFMESQYPSFNIRFGLSYFLVLLGIIAGYFAAL